MKTDPFKAKANHWGVGILQPDVVAQEPPPLREMDASSIMSESRFLQPESSPLKISPAADSDVVRIYFVPPPSTLYRVT